MDASVFTGEAANLQTPTGSFHNGFSLQIFNLKTTKDQNLGKTLERRLPEQSFNGPFLQNDKDPNLQPNQHRYIICFNSVSVCVDGT